MLSDPTGFLFLTLLALSGFWSLPRTRPAWRGLWLIFISAVFIMMVSPPALAFTTAVTLISCISLQGMRKGRAGTILGFSIVLILAVLVVAKLYFQKMGHPLATLGLSFLVLKSIAAMVDGYYHRQQEYAFHMTDLFLLNFFYPIFTAGPIERVDAFVREKLSHAFQIEDFLTGLARIAIGLFKISFLAEGLLSVFLESRYESIFSPAARFSTIESWGYVWIRFLILYINFSGYSDVAIGTGRLFGIKIMENFRYPLLAKNIQNFWQRWHLSLANFIFRYPFVHVARWTRGKVEVGIVASFVLVGLWHQLTVNYLVWGLCHGLALVGASKYKGWAGRHPVWSRVGNSRLHALLAWFITLNLVAFLSVFANAGGWSQAVMVCKRLVGY